MNFLSFIIPTKIFIIENEKYTSVKGKIGEGAYAYVNRVKNKSGRDFAIKRVICTTQEQLLDAEKEISTLQTLQSHVNILPFLGRGSRINKRGQNEILILMPFYTNGTVQHVIDAGDGYPSCAFSKHNLKEIFLGLVNGLQFMHTIKNLRHNDLKPTNFLLSKENHVVITDFGSVSQCVTPIRTRKEALILQEEAASKTTPSIRPPELWDCPSNIDIDGAVDIWSLGCCFYTMIYSRNPFECPQQGLANLSVMSAKYNTPLNSLEKCYDPMIRSCIHTDPTQRVSLDKLKLFLQTDNHNNLIQSIVENIIEPNNSDLNRNDTPMNFADFANFSENFP